MTTPRKPAATFLPAILASIIGGSLFLIGMGGDLAVRGMKHPPAWPGALNGSGLLLILLAHALRWSFERGQKRGPQ